MHFINSRLIPTSHETRVNWERAVLVFCIVNRKKFDDGRIINKQLAANMGRRQPFYFPCLVTKICKRAGLNLKHPDIVETIPMGTFIDQSTLKRMRENEGLEEKEEGEREEEEEVEGEEKTETIEGASESTKKEEQQETPKTTQRPPARKTTAGMRKGPEEGSTSTARTLTMWGMGADILAKQIQNIERMLAQEIRDIKEASLLIAIEKEHLESELEKLKNQEPPSKKRKAEFSGEKEEAESDEMLKDLVNTVKALKQELLEKDEAHKEEKMSWSEELHSLKNE